MDLQHIKTTRVSIDLAFEDHMHLKIACARQGIPIRQFIIESIEKNLKEMEEKYDEEAFDRGKEDIKSHGTVSLEEMDKRLGYNVQNRNQRKTRQKTAKNSSKGLRQNTRKTS